MNDPPPISSEWDRPVGTDTSTSCRRAAVLTWVLGVAEVLFSCCCAGSFMVLASLSPQQLEQAMATSQVTSEQMTEIMSIQSLATAIAVTMLILGLAPALAYLGLGFLVRRGSRVAIGLTLLLAAMQSIVFAILAAISLLQALLAADPVAITVYVLLYGTGLVLLGFTIYWLWKALLTSGDQYRQR